MEVALIQLVVCWSEIRSVGVCDSTSLLFKHSMFISVSQLVHWSINGTKIRALRRLSTRPWTRSSAGKNGGRNTPLISARILNVMPVVCPQFFLQKWGMKRCQMTGKCSDFASTICEKVHCNMYRTIFHYPCNIIRSQQTLKYLSRRGCVYLTSFRPCIWEARMSKLVGGPLCDWSHSKHSNRDGLTVSRILGTCDFADADRMPARAWRNEAPPTPCLVRQFRVGEARDELRASRMAEAVGREVNLFLPQIQQIAITPHWSICKQLLICLFKSCLRVALWSVCAVLL